MNKFKGDIGGHKFSINDLEWNGDSTEEQLKNIIRALVGTSIENKIILYGCEVTKVGTDYTNTAGAIYYNGEIYTVDAMITALSSPTAAKWFIDITYGAENPVTYKDGTPHNVHYIRKLKLVDGAGTGEFVYNDISIKKLSTLIKADSKANIIQENWHYVGDPGEPAFQNSWNNGGISSSGGGGDNLRFMKDTIGWVHLDGFISGGGIINTIIQLPIGYRPDRDFCPSAQIAGNGFALMYVKTDGKIHVFSFLSGANNQLHIDIKFKAA